MRKSLPKTIKSIPAAWAAGLLSMSYFLSILLGFLRDRLLLANFGVGGETDAYGYAFIFPDMIYLMLVSGALSVTMIPVFNQRYQSGNKSSAWQLVSSLTNYLTILTLGFGIVMVAFAEPIVEHIVARGVEDPQIQKDAIVMMRIIAVNPITFAISSVFVSVQQAVGRFFHFALAPLMYNISIIFGILFLGDVFGIYGVAIGVFVGSFVQLAVAIFGMKGLGYNYERLIYWKNQGFRKVLRLLPARSIDQGIDAILVLIEATIASYLIEGSLTSYRAALTLHLAPVALIGIAISTAVFPKMSERINQGRPDLFKKELRGVIRTMIWLSLPVVVFVYLARGYLVRLLVGEGNAVIATLLGIFSIAIIFRTLFHILSRAFYAQQDTRTPLIISIMAIALNILLALLFVFTFDLGVNGLAYAQAAIAIFETIVLTIVLSHRLDKIWNIELLLGVTKMIFAAVVMGFVTYFMIRILPLEAGEIGFVALVPELGLVAGISFLFYLALCKLLRIEESYPIVDKFIQIVERPIK